MALPFVMVLPLLIIVAAGVYYIYNEVTHYMSKSLVRNKVVVITDAVSGVGTECAQLFHKAGARLILCGTSWDRLESLFDSLTSDADPRETFAPKLVILDFSDMDSIEDVVAEVLECYGCLDVLVCNSSVKLKAPVQSTSLEMDRNIMDINYFGPEHSGQRRSGHILLVNSIQGRLAIPFRSSYAASKHAAQAFFDCLRAEVEEYGIIVSTISHTFINASDPVGEPAPKQSALAAFIARQMTHGLRPSVLANEVMQTVNRKRKEVVLAHPIPRVALYLRSLFPPFLFAVLASGVKDSVLDGIVIRPEGGRAIAVTSGTLVEAVLDSGDSGINGGTAGCDLLCSAEIMANCPGLWPMRWRCQEPANEKCHQSLLAAITTRVRVKGGEGTETVLGEFVWILGRALDERQVEKVLREQEVQASDLGEALAGLRDPEGLQECINQLATALCRIMNHCPGSGPDPGVTLL
ncbi:unnamed protein product [Pleuronectes platessa]|uniref:Dehydrogenase/reductase SDR family member 7C n=1 Tax=Pleuronectes platessa TaxID=8262 RepID=A0A9N7TM98_PLEPL|nr:unnamed protein product [Pleuronectes platessa]